MDTNLGAPKPRHSLSSNNNIPLPLPRTSNKNTINYSQMDDISIDVNNEDNSKDNKINILNNEIDKVTNVLNDNIRVSLSNIEDTEVLTEKTQELRLSSNIFNKQSKRTKMKMYWKNQKLKCIIGGIVVIIIIIILH